MVLYTIGIFIYGFAIRIASLINPKAKSWIKGRKNFFNQLPKINDEKVVWFHCASLGEFEQGKPIIEEWKNKYPDDFILITFFSPSGYEIKKDYPLADFCCYLPLDTPSNAKRFVNYFRPDNVFFIKYEFWLNYIKYAYKNGSKIYSLSAIFRGNQIFFKWYGGIFRKHLSYFSYFFVQNEASKSLLEKISIDNVVVAGDTRFDNVYERYLAQEDNLILKNWAKDSHVFIIGSSWPEDEQILFPFVSLMNYKVIIAPHNVDDKHVSKLISKLTIPYQKYTDLENGNVLEENTKVIVLDCIGLLANAYKYGDIAYVGGAFGTGLHNILEPATFGLPVIFGPKYEKFPEAKIFIENGIGFSINNRETLKKEFNYILSNKKELSERTISFIKKNIGAKEKVFEVITSSL